MIKKVHYLLGNNVICSDLHPLIQEVLFFQEAIMVDCSIKNYNLNILVMEIGIDRGDRIQY